MIQLLQQIPIDRAATLILLAGQLYAQFKAARRSIREHGQRIGALEKANSALEARVAALEARIAALEASGKRG